VIAGASSGGLASSYAAFRHPELFGNVISQSGSYWRSPDTNSSVLARGVEGEWLTRQFAAEEKKAIRFFIEIGLNEGGRPSMVIVNRTVGTAALRFSSAVGYHCLGFSRPMNGGGASRRAAAKERECVPTGVSLAGPGLGFWSRS